MVLYGDLAYTDSQLWHQSPLLLWPFELPGDREQRIGKGDGVDARITMILRGSFQEENGSY